MDDTDIRNLSAEDAKAYTLEFITALKSVERELASITNDCNIWAKRVELAIAKGASELEQGAKAKLAELNSKKSVLEAEKADLNTKVSRLREKLPLAGMAERSVDPDLLLATLRGVAGMEMDDRDDVAPKLESDLKSLGTEDALAELKRKLGK